MTDNTNVVSDHKFSVTEMLQYQRCRRMWNYQSQNRMGLVRRGRPPAPLQMGSAIHAAFAAQVAGEHPIDAVVEYFDVDAQRLATDYARRVGTTISPEEMEAHKEAQELSVALATRYFNHYGWEHPLGDNYQYVVAEMGFEIPIPGTQRPDGSQCYIVGTLDGIARELDTGRYWLVEHKTFSVTPNEEKFSTDWQMSVYCYAAEQLHGVPIAGVLYDGIAKKLPKPPAMGVKGKLSQSQQTINTTDYQTYRDTIREYDLDVADYADTLAVLRDRDRQSQTPFFIRWRFEFPQPIIEQTVKTMTALALEMSNPDTAIVPTFRYEGCWDCNMRELCKAESFGEDVDWLLKTSYERGEGHTTVKRLRLPRTEIESFDDFVTRGVEHHE